VLYEGEMKSSTLIIIAGINGFAATALGAMGSHALGLDARGTALFSQASDFHFIHTLALIGCAWMASQNSSNAIAERWASRASIFFMVGMACFCGSLYWLGIMGAGSIGKYHWITPIGGLAFMAGWLTFAWGGFRVGKTA